MLVGVLDTYRHNVAGLEAAGIAKVDLARRELNLALIDITSRGGRGNVSTKPQQPSKHQKAKQKGKHQHRGGESRRNRVSKQRGRGRGGR